MIRVLHRCSKWYFVLYVDASVDAASVDVPTDAAYLSRRPTAPILTTCVFPYPHLPPLIYKWQIVRN